MSIETFIMPQMCILNILRYLLCKKVQQYAHCTSGAIEIPMDSFLTQINIDGNTTKVKHLCIVKPQSFYVIYGFYV